MPTDIDFRLARDAHLDAAAFCTLSNSLYARKVDERYFRWQFFDCPHAPFLMTGWAGDRMVAAYGVHVVTAASETRAMSLDIMIAEDHQGRGLIAPLATAALEEARRGGATRLAVVGNARARDAMGRRLGWKIWSVLSDWTGPTNGLAATPARVVERPAASRFAQGPESFYPRDDATLAWRTGRSPRYAYTWLEAGPSEAPLGWAVVKLFRDPVSGDGFGDIVGLFPADPSSTAAVIDTARAWFSTQGIGSAAFYPLDSAQREIAGRLGFTASSRQRFLCGEGEAPPDLAVGMLDVDVY